jgi:chemotaxis methyl-accepting protein methylase
MPAEQPVPGAPGLARGELSPRDAAELQALKRLIEARSGLRCDGYKERVLRRRLAVRMRARDVGRYAAYGALLDDDPGELNRLLDAVTINVSKFFRNTEVWNVVRSTVVPALAMLDVPVVRVWSAGSAAGEEAFSIAMLLREHAEHHGTDLHRFEILATDIDANAIELARKGETTEFALSETPRAQRERWFEGPHLRQLRPEILRMVRFERLDLLRDPYPADQHLIFCRNVIIYFERPVQEDVFRRLHGALAPGGWLLLGKVEAIFGTTLRLFRTVASRERLFQKP